MTSLLAYALTTVSDVKESLNIPSSNTTKDNLITRKINQATRAIEAYCQRRFLQTAYVDELYTAPNTNQIVLRQRPIVGSVVLKVRDTSLNDTPFETVETQLYFADATSGVLDLNYNAIGSWGRYAISYTAGYLTIPEDLAEACATLAAYYVNNADGSNVGLAMKQEGQRATRFGNNNHLLTFENIMAQLGIDEILNSYANYPIILNR